MSATKTFRFGQKYTLRPAGMELADYQLAEDWTKADSYHCCCIDPRFWVEQGNGADAYFFFDGEGPLFFFKMVLVENDVVEIYIQFPPQKELKHQRQRIAKGLIEGMEWLEKILIQIKMREMRFDSIHRQLVAFALKRLGFMLEGGKLRKRLAA